MQIDRIDAVGDQKTYFQKHPLNPEHRLPAPVEVSDFSTKYPKWRAEYIVKVWPIIERVLNYYKIDCKLDEEEKKMTVSTTRKTWDPFSIMKAKSLLVVVARGVPVAKAIEVMKDDMHCEVVRLRETVKNKDLFIKRRQRLIGLNGSTLKAIQVLTKCYVYIVGGTASIIGNFKQVKQATRIILKCMEKNQHPVTLLQQMMIKRELAEDPSFEGKSWNDYLPKMAKSKKKKSRGIKQKLMKRKKLESERDPYPKLPAQTKLDKQIETGEYFFKESLAKRKKHTKVKGKSKKKRRN